MHWLKGIVGLVGIVALGSIACGADPVTVVAPDGEPVPDPVAPAPVDPGYPTPALATIQERFVIAFAVGAPDQSSWYCYRSTDAILDGCDGSMAACQQEWKVTADLLVKDHGIADPSQIIGECFAQPRVSCYTTFQILKNEDFAFCFADVARCEEQAGKRRENKNWKDTSSCGIFGVEGGQVGQVQ